MCFSLVRLIPELWKIQVGVVTFQNSVTWGFVVRPKCVIFNSGGLNFMYRIIPLVSHHVMWFVHSFWCSANVFSNIICRYHLCWDGASGCLATSAVWSNGSIVVIVDVVNFWGAAATVALIERYFISPNALSKASILHILLYTGKMFTFCVYNQRKIQQVGEVSKGIEFRKQWEDWELERKDLALLDSPLRQKTSYTPPPTHKPYQPTIFPACAAYFPCQGGVLDSKFHRMSKTARQTDYIKTDVEDGGVSWVWKAGRIFHILML